MRLFETVTFNVKSVKFHETKAFLDELLHTNGITYDKAAVYADHISDNARRKIEKSYTALMPYVSGTEGSYDLLALPVAPEARETLFALLEKIPRGVPITDIGVMLDGVNWNGARQQAAVYQQPSYPYAMGARDFHGYYSDHIQFYKAFHFGTKRNPVSLMVERFVEGDTLLPLPPSFEALCERLGKPERRERECVFDTEMQAMWHKKQQAIKAGVNKTRYNDRFAAFVRADDGALRERLARLPQELQPMAGFSPKSVLQKAAKPRGFRLESCRQGEYAFVKTTPHGHRFSATVTIPPMTSYVFMHVRASGWNMSVFLGGTPQVTVQEEETLSRYATIAFETADDIVDEYADRLVDEFGATPLWFWET